MYVEVVNKNLEFELLRTDRSNNVGILVSYLIELIKFTLRISISEHNRAHHKIHHLQTQITAAGTSTLNDRHNHRLYWGTTGLEGRWVLSKCLKSHLCELVKWEAPSGERRPMLQCKSTCSTTTPALLGIASHLISYRSSVLVLPEQCLSLGTNSYFPSRL